MSGRIPEPESPITCGDAGEGGSIWLRANPQGVWMVGDDGQGGEIGPWLAPWAEVLKHAPTEALIAALKEQGVEVTDIPIGFEPVLVDQDFYGFPEGGGTRRGTMLIAWRGPAP